MPIEITITYSPENITLTQTSYEFSDEGGTLGRGSNNFWVLEDPNKYMSSVHAKISCVGKKYYLTDMSTNGTFINGSSEPVGNGNQVLITDGDQFTISDYEFVVKLNNELSLDTIQNSADSDPFADLNSFSAPTSSDLGADDFFKEMGSNDPFPSFNSDSTNNELFSTAEIGIGGFATTQETDPLALLDKGNSKSLLQPSSSILDFVQENLQLSKSSNIGFFEETSPENNHVVNESIDWPKAHQENNVIPDDWGDDLGFASVGGLFNETQSVDSFINVAPTATEPQSIDPFADNNVALFSETQSVDTFINVAPTATESQSIDVFADNNDAPFSEAQSVDSFINVAIKPQEINLSDNNDSVFSKPETPVEHRQQIEVKTATSIPPVNNVRGAESAPVARHSDIEYASLDKQNKQLHHENVKLKIQLAKAQQASSTENPPLDIDTLNVVIEAMGLSKWNLDVPKKTEINEMVGLLMRETMQGMMQVLKFRKKIKEEFRINVTTIQSVENNPLKFSANIEDALENMFIKENNAYKTPIEAVKEGFEDIAEHQVAVIAGMQAAFRGMLERFDPVHLESRFEKYNGTSLLSLGKKTKQWRSYKDYHQELVDNIDDSFQHLFGYDFVQAYEEQMQNLIQGRISAKTNTTN